ITFPTAAATITRRKSFGTAAAMVVLLLLGRNTSQLAVGLVVGSTFRCTPDNLRAMLTGNERGRLAPGAQQLEDGEESSGTRKQKAPPERGFGLPRTGVTRYASLHIHPFHSAHSAHAVRMA